MADNSAGSISIEAPFEAVTAILFDIAKYPTWSTSIKSVEILGTDDQGRATSAKLSIDAGMMRDRVSLDYDWSLAPGKLSFSLSDADLLTGMDGAYIIEAQDSDTTKVTYELTVSLSMPLPAMMRTKAEKTTIDQALAQLKAFAEK